MRKRSWSDDQLVNAVAESFSYSQVITALGLKAGGGTYDHLKDTIQRLGLSTSHFTGQLWSKGKTLPVRYSHHKLQLEDVLISGEIRMSSHALKKRLIKEGIFEHRCDLCGITEWMGNPCPIELDHINGDRKDNRLQNLRVVCPNCHAQTDTYCGKNKRK